MAKAMKLADNGNTFEWDPAVGNVAPRILDVSHHRAANGKSYSYKWWIKRRWEIPMELEAKSDFEQIDDWWLNVTELTFTPDQINDSGTTYTVVIKNEVSPLSEMQGAQFAVYYGGILILEET